MLYSAQSPCLLSWHLVCKEGECVHLSPFFLRSLISCLLTWSLPLSHLCVSVVSLRASDRVGYVGLGVYYIRPVVCVDMFVPMGFFFLFKNGDKTYNKICHLNHFYILTIHWHKLHSYCCISRYGCFFVSVSWLCLTLPACVHLSVWVCLCQVGLCVSASVGFSLWGSSIVPLHGRLCICVHVALDTCGHVLFPYMFMCYVHTWFYACLHLYLYILVSFFLCSCMYPHRGLCQSVSTLVPSVFASVTVSYENVCLYVSECLCWCPCLSLNQVCNVSVWLFLCASLDLPIGGDSVYVGLPVSACLSIPASPCLCLPVLLVSVGCVYIYIKGQQTMAHKLRMVCIFKWLEKISWVW